MNENINLYELIKKYYNGETLYSPIVGDVKVEIDYEKYGEQIWIKSPNCVMVFGLDTAGRYNDCGETMLFPSRHQRDWNEWAAEKRAESPKTWNDLLIKDKSYEMELMISHGHYSKPYEKAAFALVKMNILIDELYGGIPTKEERFTPNNPIFVVDYVDNQWQPIKTYYNIEPIAFHTEEQCLEFLSYPENVQLLKDFYMI